MNSEHLKPAPNIRKSCLLNILGCIYDTGTVILFDYISQPYKIDCMSVSTGVM